MMNNTTKSINNLAQTINSIECLGVLDELKRQAKWMPYRLINNEIKTINENCDVIYPDDNSNWRSFNEAKETAKLVNADGLGFVFGDGYTSITLDTTADCGYDGIVPEIAKTQRFLNSYTEWTHERKLRVFCKVSEAVHNVEIYLSRRDKQLKCKNACNFTPISGIPYGTPEPISERTGKVIYMHEVFSLIDKDYLHYLNICCYDIQSVIDEAADVFVKRCVENGIINSLEGNVIHLKAPSDCNSKTVAFMKELLNTSRYLQAAVISKFNADNYNFLDKLSNLYSQNLPCSLLDGAMAIVFGLDKYQLYR